jgi:peptidoglycan/LPS O-acetylase OafA/YrhL
MVLNPGTSLYLDFARISAAVLVLLHHVFQLPFYESSLHFPGPAAVVIFFVISGFVIAYASDGLADWREYAVARLARIYSVALPALLLTGALYAMGQLIWPAGTQPNFDRPWVRLIMSTLFINQMWNLTTAPLTNGPYWSLCYEVWYYVLFGVGLFMRGWPRGLTLAAICMAVGPRILLLLPTWLIGYGLYHAMKGGWRLSNRLEGALFWCCAAACAATLSGLNPADPLSDWVGRQLESGAVYIGSQSIHIGGEANFPSSYILACTFAGSVLFSRAAFSRAFTDGPLAAGIRVCSSYTFSLYLYHAPLLVFLHPPLAAALVGAWVPWTAAVAIVAAVVLLGNFTEHRKRPYAKLFRGLLGLSRRRVSALPEHGR